MERVAENKLARDPYPNLVSQAIRIFPRGAHARGKGGGQLDIIFPAPFPPRMRTTRKNTDGLRD